MSGKIRTVGILYPGELGSALGASLRKSGLEVVTSVEGRSRRTRQLSALAGFQTLDSLDDVVSVADLVISLVAPDAATTLARRYLESISTRPLYQIYMDANSIAPASVTRIAESLAAREVEFLDGAVVGPASRIGRGTTLYLSGRRAQAVSEALAPCIQVKIVGNVPGRASTMKMLLAGMNKGIAALFLEMGLVAAELGSLDSFVAEYGGHYPGIMEILERMIPTYARHSKRRGDELRELEEMMHALDLEPSCVRGARELIEGIGRMVLPEVETFGPSQESSAVRGLFLELARQNPLRPPRENCA